VENKTYIRRRKQKFCEGRSSQVFLDYGLLTVWSFFSGPPEYLTNILRILNGMKLNFVDSFIPMIFKMKSA
jgi:hypothetical protein